MALTAEQKHQIAMDVLLHGGSDDEVRAAIAAEDAKAAVSSVRAAKPSPSMKPVSASEPSSYWPGWFKGLADTYTTKQGLTDVVTNAPANFVKGAWGGAKGLALGAAAPVVLPIAMVRKSLEVGPDGKYIGPVGAAKSLAGDTKDMVEQAAGGDPDALGTLLGGLYMPGKVGPRAVRGTSRALTADPIAATGNFIRNNATDIADIASEVPVKGGATALIHGAGEFMKRKLGIEPTELGPRPSAPITPPPSAAPISSTTPTAPLAVEPNALAGPASEQVLNGMTRAQAKAKHIAESRAKGYNKKGGLKVSLKQQIDRLYDENGELKVQAEGYGPESED